MRYFWAIVLAFFLVACDANQQTQPVANIEFRPAAFEPQTGFIEMTVKASEQKIYVSESIILSTPDIASAETTFDALGAPSVGLKLTVAGKQKLADATGRYLHKPIAVIVNGECLTAPVVNEKITGGMLTITGATTAKEAKDIVDSFNQ